MSPATTDYGPMNLVARCDDPFSNILNRDITFNAKITQHSSIVKYEVRKYDVILKLFSNIFLSELEMLHLVTTTQGS